MNATLQGDSARARLRPEPPVAEIGQRVTWTLTVNHPPGSSVHLGEAFSRPDIGWAAEGRGSVRRKAPAEARVGDGGVLQSPDGTLTTTLTWTGLPLEYGHLAPPGGEISWSGPRGREVLEPEVLALKVNGELAEGEDLPRAPAGLESALAATPASGAVPLAWATPLCLLLVLAVFVLTGLAFLRRRRDAGPRAVPTPREELARLRAEQRAQPGGEIQMTRRLDELSGILRRAGNLAGAQQTKEHSPAPGLTDEEWLTWLAAERLLSPEQMKKAQELYTALAATRFSQRCPTRFAVERMLEQGQMLLDNLERAAVGATKEIGIEQPAMETSGAVGRDG